MTQAPVSHCGCVLPDGAWGSCGWHFKAYGPAEARATADLSTARNGVNRESKEWRDAFAGAMRYEGTPIGYEQCPAYLNALERNRRGEAAARTTSRFGDKRY